MRAIVALMLRIATMLRNSYVFVGAGNSHISGPNRKRWPDEWLLTAMKKDWTWLSAQL
jgi:hypothetical protein